MRIRKMSPGDPNDDTARDMVFGSGQADFYRDVPEAPAQLAECRLMLFAGEWYQDLTAGTPWNTQVLGKYTGAIRDPIIRTRLLGTTGISGIAAYDSSLNRDTRQFAVQATLDTIYGQAAFDAPSPL